jgi:hypothetical protein
MSVCPLQRELDLRRLVGVNADARDVFPVSRSHCESDMLGERVLHRYFWCAPQQPARCREMQPPSLEAFDNLGGNVVEGDELDLGVMVVRHDGHRVLCVCCEDF